MFFYNVMIRLDSTYDSGLNEPLFGKIGARILNLWLDTSFVYEGPQCSFQAIDPKFKETFDI